MLHLAIASIVKHDGPLKTFTFGPTAIETTIVTLQKLFYLLSFVLFKYLKT